MPTNHTTVSRRAFLSGLQRVIGVTAATTLLAGNSMSVALAFQPDPANPDLKVFSAQQMQILKTVCNLVIPATQTPGAADVYTHLFIDNQLFHCHKKNEQDSVLKTIDILQQADFLAKDKQQQILLLEQLDTGHGNFTVQQRNRFKFLKYMICFGYYTSEVGASQELRYVAVPGGFKGDIKLKSGESSWGSQALYY